MVQLMVKFTGRITLSFILPVNFNGKLIAKIVGRVILGFILPEILVSLKS